MKRILMAAAIATAFITLPTMASVYSTASLNNFRLELVDLNLEDGITPSVIFTQSISSQINGTVQYFGNGKVHLDVQDNFYQKGDFNKVLSGSVSDSLSTASAFYEAGENFGLSYQASGNTAGNTELGVYGGYISSSFDFLYFTLSANLLIGVQYFPD